MQDLKGNDGGEEGNMRKSKRTTVNSCMRKGPPCRKKHDRYHVGHAGMWVALGKHGIQRACTVSYFQPMGGKGVRQKGKKESRHTGEEEA